MPRQTFTISLTDRQADALRSLAEAEDIPPEIYAVEVLVKHLYHAFRGPSPERAPDSTNER